MTLDTVYSENLEKLSGNDIFCTNIAFMLKKQSIFLYHKCKKETKTHTKMQKKKKTLYNIASLL